MLRKAARIAVGAVVSLAVGVPGAGAATLPGSLPKLPGATDLGAATAASPGVALVGLEHRDQKGLLAFIAQVSNPKSRLYRHYLTAAQFDARYAPSASTVSAVESYLRGAGLRVVQVPSDRAYVLVSGTLGSLGQAFGTRLDEFSRAGKLFDAPDSALHLPSSIARQVTAVAGLDTGVQVTPMDLPSPLSSLQSAPAPAYVNSPPFSSYFGSTPATQAPQYENQTLPDVVQGYTAAQMEGAYGLSGAIASGLNGAGQTVTVIDAFSSPTIVADADEWSKLNGLPQPNITVNDNQGLEELEPEGPQIPTDIPAVGGLNLQDPDGWYGEETLDVEAVHAMAPAAAIIVQTAVVQGLGITPDSLVLMDIAQAEAVTADDSQEISNSYGISGSDYVGNISDQLWQQAAAQGQGVEFSSGDSGDNSSGGTSTSTFSVDSYPNSPYVTAVGGTSLAVGAQNNYEWETYWGVQTSTLTNGTWPAPSWDAGGGGGISQAYAEPSFQSKVVPSSLANFWGDPTHESSSWPYTGSRCSMASEPDAGLDCSEVPGRVVPDVAMDADAQTGLLIGETEDFNSYSNPDSFPLPTDTIKFGEYRIGGTSLSSPLFAGVMALADQAAGKSLGFADPALYNLYSAAPGDFHKPVITPPVPGVVRTNYNNATDSSGGTTTVLRTFGFTGLLQATPGYDDATGLGSPDGMAFICGMSANSKLAAGVPDSPCAPGAGSTSGSGSGSGSGSNSGSASNSGSGSSSQTGITPEGASVVTTTGAGSGSGSGSGSGTGSTPSTGTAKSCTLPVRIAFAPRGREVKVLIYIDGKLRRTLRGKRLRTLTLTRPAGASGSIHVVAYLANGEVTQQTYTFSGCRQTAALKILRRAKRR